MTIKDIEFLGDSLEVIRNFNKETKRDIGLQLDYIQNGLEPDDWKAMTSIGLGVKEIRVRNAFGAFRTVYVIKKRSSIFVLHAFEKKTQQTPKKEIDLAKERLKQIKP